MSSGPIVSAIIPAYNSAATIARALYSVQAQTHPPDEIVVVDDLSSDNTRQVVSDLALANLRIVSTGRRMGAGGARNAGVRAASGDIIAFLDSDDEWLPQKLEKQLALLELDRRLWFVACGANSISPAGKDLGDTYGLHRIATGSEAWKVLLACNFIATPSVILWRNHFEALGGFDEQLKIGEDQDLWIRLALSGSLGYVPEPLVKVHLREDSLSSWTLDALLTNTLPMIERHIASQRHQLTQPEICRILGERLNRFGRVAYVRGSFLSGLHLIGRSIRLGYHPFESLLYLLRAAPPLLWMKRRIRLRAF